MTAIRALIDAPVRDLAVIGLLWFCAGGFVLCIFNLLKLWVQHRAEWGGVYEHHDAMGALAPEARRA